MERVLVLAPHTDDVEIGANTVVAHAMIGGSAHIGERAWIGPGALVRNRLAVGGGAYVSMGSVATLDVAPGEHVTGDFAVPHERFLEHLRETR